MKARISHRSGLLRLAVGFLVWTSAFAVLYAVLSVGCAWNWHLLGWGPFDLLRSILLVVWVGHMAGLFWLYRADRKQTAGPHAALPSTRSFFRVASLAATAAAMAATLWIGLAIPFVSLCV